VKYLRALSDGSATCEARIAHLGRRVGHASAVVTDDRGKEIALGDSILLMTHGEATPEPKG
jgi:acyl-coenzyme A thioesterase PaaI-like protein